MPILMDFYAGDPVVIGTAFSSHDFRTLNDRSAIPLFVDFSLHISPTDCDLLTTAIQSVVGAGPTSLIASLQTEVGSIGDSASAHTIAAEWVAMAAAVRDEQVENILRLWVRAVAQEHNELESAITADMRSAVQALIVLCRTSRERGLAVVYTWSL